MTKSEQKIKQLQSRRLRAGRLLLQGVPQAEVARRVGVSRASVCDWNTRLAQGGLEALRRRPRGRPAGLDGAMRTRLVAELKAGAMAHGFATELWTLRRIGELIQRLFGQQYSESQVWRILSGLNWSCQRPSGRALERNEEAIRAWKYQRWPRVKKTAAPSGA